MFCYFGDRICVACLNRYIAFSFHVHKTLNHHQIASQEIFHFTWLYGTLNDSIEMNATTTLKLTKRATQIASEFEHHESLLLPKNGHFVWIGSGKSLFTVSIRATKRNGKN